MTETGWIPFCITLYSSKYLLSSDIAKFECFAMQFYNKSYSKVCKIFDASAAEQLMNHQLNILPLLPSSSSSSCKFNEVTDKML